MSSRLGDRPFILVLASSKEATFDNTIDGDNGTVLYWFTSARSGSTC